MGIQHVHLNKKTVENSLQQVFVSLDFFFPHVFIPVENAPNSNYNFECLWNVLINKNLLASQLLFIKY